MADPIRCPHCGQTYAVTPGQAAQYAGQTITCTNCNQPFTVPPLGGPAAAPPMPAAGVGPGPSHGGPYGAAAGPQKSNGLAVGSLVAGVIGLVVPLLGLVGVVLGVLGLRRARDPGIGGRGLAIAGISTGAVGLVLSSCLVLMPAILLPSLNRAREQANRIKCASNLRQIGMAAQMYAADNKTQFPPDFQTLLQKTDLTPDVFVCPTTDHTPAPGASASQQAQNLGAGPHLSYAYAGSGLTSAAPPDAILAYEVPDNHGGGPGPGANFVYADGHVEWRTDAQLLIDELKAGHNPPRPQAERGR